MTTPQTSEATRTITEILPFSEEFERVFKLEDEYRRLMSEREQAEAQLLLRIKFGLDGGSVSRDQLMDIYLVTRGKMTNSFPAQWERILRHPYSAMAARLHHRNTRQARDAGAPPNGPGGVWLGNARIGPDDPMPPRNACVVYVLFDAHRQAVYIGSTQQLRTRITGHRRDGKDFETWMAIRCVDRAAAYELEDKLLRDHKLPLNRRARR